MDLGSTVHGTYSFLLLFTLFGILDALFSHTDSRSHAVVSQPSVSQGLPCPPRRHNPTASGRIAHTAINLDKDLDHNAEARLADGVVEHLECLDPLAHGAGTVSQGESARRPSSIDRGGVADQTFTTAGGDKSTPLSVRTTDLARRAHDSNITIDSPHPLTPSSSFLISSASVSVPISAVKPTNSARRLLSPRSVSARFAHPYLNQRTPSSSYLTSPTAMAAVDRRSPLSFGSTTPPLGVQAAAQPEGPSASTSFPISPLTPTGMRAGRRKAPPTWPNSPKGSMARGTGSPHDPDLDSPGYLQTPSILRNIPPPSATPTTSSFAHTPLTAGYASRSFNSAPTSNARGEPPASASGSRQQIPPRDRRRREGIPKSYFVKSLHNLAPNFWNKPATADCRIRESLMFSMSVAYDANSYCHLKTIVIPVRGPGQTTPSPSQYASFQNSHAQAVVDDAATPTTATSSAHIYGGVSPALVNTQAFASTQTDIAPGPEQGTTRQRRVSGYSA